MSDTQSAASRPEVKQGKRKPIASFAFVALNIVIIAVMFMTVMNYTHQTRQSVQQRNILSASNATSAVTESVMLYFTNQQRMLKQQKHYIETSDELSTYDETVAYLTRVNNDDFCDYQLLDAETFSGVSISHEKLIEPVVYNATGTFFVELQQAASDSLAGKVDDEYINILPVFSNPVTGMQSVAFYTDLYLKSQDGAPGMYLLMFVIKVNDLLGSGLPTPPYDNAGAAIISDNGDYIVKTNTFKSTNIFEYFRGYGDLSYPQLDQMRHDIAENPTGYYFLRDHRGEERIFVYNTIGQTRGWTYFSSIPLASMELYTIDYIFVFIVVGFVLLLAVTDALIILRLNIRLKKSLADARRASEAKGSFMSNMSHEIRTPLNAVIGYNTIARDEMAAMESDERNKQSQMKVLDCLKKSEIASKHLLTIINDVLDMSAIESGKVKIAHEQFDFKGLITSLTTIFYSQARAKGINFQVIFLTPPDEWFVGDQMRTNQILTNLLSNAIKFTSEGGMVTLTIRRLESDDKAAHIRFEVSDTGIGMTAQSLEYIWTPFEQADSSIARRFGGTGLGLSITKNLVNIMGGSISVSSELGKGTTFTVDLAFEMADRAPESITCDFGAINALVVDDDESTCDYIKQMFTRCGAKCDTTTSGEEALKAISKALEAQKPYTLCIVDWRMPTMDGIETIRRIRRLTGDESPTIVLTAYDFTEISDIASEMGIINFISKPLFQSTLFDLLVKICGKQPSGKTYKDKHYRFSGQRVLLAEDNDMNMEIAKRLMMSVGLAVDSAWDGQQAVEMFTASDAGTYQAVLMDIQMPRLNGLDATRAIRASDHPQAVTIPIIAMTADAFAQNVAESLDAGMNSHLAKPIDLPVFFATLEKYIISEQEPRDGNL